MGRSVIGYLILTVLGFTGVVSSLDNCDSVKEEFSKIGRHDVVPDSPVAGKLTGSADDSTYCQLHR